MSPQQRGQDAQTTDLAVILTPAVRSALRPFALEEKAIGVINVRPHRNLPTSTTCIILFILKPVIFFLLILQWMAFHYRNHPVKSYICTGQVVGLIFNVSRLGFRYLVTKKKHVAS